MQYSRYLIEILKVGKSRGKARLVLGARQTGKSTLFRMIADSETEFFDLQERSLRMRLLRDPESLTRLLLPAGSRMKHVMIDEVQRVPEILDEIQLLLDRYPEKFRFTLTGSSARSLRKGRFNLLPGRMHKHLLFPVSTWEWEGTSTGTLLSCPNKKIERGFPHRSLDNLLLFGALPAAFTECDEFRRTLESYAELYIEEEVMREAAARNLGDYGRFLELAAIESGKPINLTNASQETGVSMSTIRGFYSVLADTLIGFTVQPFSHSGKARILKTPKFYIFDIGVRNAIARLPLEKSILVSHGGMLFKHWVACELAARVGYLGNGYRLSYWRTVDGAEVDFIVETPQEVIPVEVKYTSNPRPADASGVEHFITRYPKVARRGFVVCRTKRQEQLSKHVRAVPWEEM